MESLRFEFLCCLCGNASEGPGGNAIYLENAFIVDLSSFHKRLTRRPIVFNGDRGLGTKKSSGEPFLLCALYLLELEFAINFWQ